MVDGDRRSPSVVLTLWRCQGGRRRPQVACIRVALARQMATSQGRQDSNPHVPVLETGPVPVEAHPYAVVPDKRKPPSRAPEPRGGRGSRAFGGYIAAILVSRAQGCSDGWLYPSRFEIAQNVMYP